MISQAEYLEILTISVGPAVLGIVASTVRTIRYGWKGFRHFLAGLFTSVFVAVITGLMLEMAELPATAVTAIVGINAYCGVTLLDAVLWRADKEIRTCKIPGIQSVDEAPRGEAEQ